MKPEQIEPCHVGSTLHAAADRRGKATGHLLCEKHFTQLAALLREIEAEVGNLDIVPSVAMDLNTDGGGHSSSPANERSPARMDPLVLTDHRLGRGDSEDAIDRHAAGRVEPVLIVLGEYASRIRRERNLSSPSVTANDCADRWTLGGRPHGPYFGLPCRHLRCSGVVIERRVFLPLTVATERQVLTRQLEWVAKWNDVDEVFTRLRRLVAQLRQANGTAEHPVGKCPVTKADGNRCGGALWPAKPKHTVGEWSGSTPSAVRCSACDSRWEGAGDLARLALILEQQKKGKTP